MRALLVLLAGCADVASSDPGLGDLLYVDGAQFRPGPFPRANGGPVVEQAVAPKSTIVLGTNDATLHGVLDPDARTVIVGIPGARGTWIVPAGPPDFATPGQPSLSATFGIGEALGPGPFELDIAAVDAESRIGDTFALPLIAADNAPPDGDLVIGVDWTGAADLDLHVIDPTGAEAWVDHPNTYQQPPPGSPGVDPCGWATGGILDHDANASCVRDGSPSEHVIWKSRMCGTMTYAPVIPAGTYTVRVDARSLCGDASAAWAVSVYREGELQGAARGIATPYDVEYAPHGAGAGITALQIQLQ
jgi:hypothetical protein